MLLCFFFFKQKTAYDMRISDWSSDVCSSDLIAEEYPGVSFRRVESVSGKVSGELIQDGILAVLFAMIGIAIYSWFRFEWHFGVSTLVALFHDVTVTLGFFALTGMEFDLNIVEIGRASCRERVCQYV